MRFANLNWQQQGIKRAKGLAQDARGFAQANPYPVGIAAGIIANQAIGNPIGGVVDALTGNLLNFRPDSTQSVATQAPIVMQVDPVGQSSSQPKPQFVLDSEEQSRQADYLKRKIATDMLTLEALQLQKQRGDM